MVWPARAATCNRVLITSAGVTSEAAGIPARKDSTFAVGSLSHCVKVTVPRTARRGKKVKAGIESKSLFAVASGKRSCDSRLQAGGSNTPNGATPRLSFPRPPTSACYAYILTQSRGIIDQHNFKWLKTNGREIWGFVRLLYFWLFFFFFFAFLLKSELLGLIFQRWSLLSVSSSCFSAAAGSHRRCLLTHIQPLAPSKP